MGALTTKEKQCANGFLLDLFWKGGLIQPGDTSAGTALSNRSTELGYYRVKSAVQTVCDEIRLRNFDFFAVDTALGKLVEQRFYADSTIVGNPTGIRKIKRSTDQLARFIADFCKTNEIYWDDVHTNKSIYEMEQYKGTVFGGALWEFGCFLSQNIETNNTTTSTTSATSAPSAPAVSRKARAVGQPPANNYKQSGPQSGNVRDLKGKPGQKVIANTRVVFCIMGDNANAASAAYALIKPLTKNAEVNGTNKVFISSSHGYTDCTCYFDDPNEANAFLQKCMTNCPAGITNLHVVKKSAESNGYFLVGTEYGDVAVSAKRLNEASLGEALKTDNPLTEYKIADIDAYTDAFFKYE